MQMRSNTNSLINLTFLVRTKVKVKINSIIYINISLNMDTNSQQHHQFSKMVLILYPLVIRLNICILICHSKKFQIIHHTKSFIQKFFLRMSFNHQL